jgi:serine/threonine-protein kinase
MTFDMPTEVVAVPFLDDRYEVGTEIGVGAIARVFEARDRVLGIDVAVKVMHLEHTRSRVVLERFALEASVAARMMSPHIVKVLGLAVTNQGAPCIVYERLVGESLAARLRREGTLSLADTADIVNQTSRALTRAHAIGVVHRDVKPDNIFLVAQPSGRPLVKLLDFGVAEVMDRPGGSAFGDLTGTPAYLAPEMLFGTHDLDARADLYALGVVAFECLTGKCPFPGSNVDEVLVKAARGVRASVTEVRSDLNEEVEEWMERALHADPYWRFASARELGDALQKAAGQARVSRPMSRGTMQRAA